ncbi:MAG: hypothetical protein LBK53_08825 [Heliobacteriaceae bacterium]|nr:hypothetical protein [Heliobacteriaceae bacterium]
MQKIILSALLFSIAMAAYAAPATYTEAATQKYTQKLVDKEKQLQRQQKTREDAAAKARKDREDAARAHKKKIETKKQQWKDLISP